MNTNTYLTPDKEYEEAKFYTICTKCGAVVRYQGLHTQWHKKQEETKHEP